MINDFVTKEDLTLFTTGSRFNLASIFLNENMENTPVTFELSVRELPKNRNYLIFAGLEHVADYLLNLNLTDDQIAWLDKSYKLTPKAKNYFKNLKFTGDMWAMPEGTIFFPNEPIIRIQAPLAEAQLIEMFLINTVYFQTIYASKLSRFLLAAENKDVTIGYNRSYGIDTAMKSTRINEMLGAGSGLSVYNFKNGNYPFSAGTYHYLISLFENELEAFHTYFKHTLGKGYVLVDTYDTIQGVKNFISVAKELEKEGIRPTGIQLDSGDLYEFSVRAREMLDQAGLDYVKIFVISNLDEYKVHDLLKQKAPIDAIGGATEILTPSDAPTLELVYKLSEIEKNGQNIPKMKTATNKVSLPGKKQVYRQIKNNRYSKDIISLSDEDLEGQKLLIPIIKKGKSIYDQPSLDEIKKYYRSELKKFNPLLFSINEKFNYGVKISPKLQKLTNKTRKSIEKSHLAV